MLRGPIVRCFIAGSIAVLLFFQGHIAYAANPSDISVYADPAWGETSPSDYSGNWLSYCSPGATNKAYWYTGDGVLRSVTPNPFNCSVDGTISSNPAGIPGAISLWNFGSSIVPNSLPHGIGNFGTDGNFYFILKSAFSGMGTTSPGICKQNCGTDLTGILTLTKDPYWTDGANSMTDLVGDWSPYCTPGATNALKWYTGDSVVRSVFNSYDCAVGMGNNASYPTSIPGAVSIWNFGSSMLPPTLPHGVGNFGTDGDFFVTLTNANGETYRYEWGWHTQETTHRFDWSWNAATGYTFPTDATATIPLQTATVTAPVIIVPGIMGSAKHNDEWVIDPITHAFDNLIDTLLANGYTKDVDLFTFPYDWHKSNVDTAVLLKQKIDDVKTICHCDKVDLVAHSMGGLVSRQYIQSNNYGHDVRNMIFIGTPHLGAPLAYLLWEGGQFDPSTFDNNVKNAVLRNQAYEAGYRNVIGSQNVFDYIHSLPIYSVEQLLPVNNYLRNGPGYTVSRTDYPTNYPRNAFLEDLNTNIGKLFASGVEITNFVGSIPNSAISEIRVVPSPAPVLSASLKWQDGFPDNFTNIFTDQGLIRSVGDEVVPLSSASFVSTSSTVFNLNHGNIITAAQGSIFKKLTNKEAKVLITDHSKIDLGELIFSIFSPADIVVIAPDGKRVGKDFQTGVEINEISGAFYSGINAEEEYVTIPNPLPGQYKVVTQGTGSGGTYTLAANIVNTATSSETRFTGLTLPGLITEHTITVNPANAGQESIRPTDQTAPGISFAQPATTTFTHADLLPIRVNFTDSTGIATTAVKFDSKPTSASTTVDLFYETLGKHIIVASSADFVNNIATSSRTIQVIATASSTISDVQRAYALGWIKSKDLKDLLIKKLNASVKIQKITDTIILSTKPKVTTTKVDRWIQIMDTLVLKSILIDLSLAKSLKLITDPATQMLSNDINWLIDN